MLLLLLRLCITIGAAFLMGKLVSKIKLPSILGWLITGMALGPHALSLMSQEILDAAWYQTMVHILECAVGLMIGTELVWNKIKRSGKSIIITTLTQSLGTFLLVSLVFGVVFSFVGIPLYLAFLFGGIALATAPAPALSIVREFKTTGPVTQTLIPMAALDDIVGCIVFFLTIAVVAGNLSAGQLPVYMIALVVVLPLLIGIATGWIAGRVLSKERGDTASLALLILLILVTSGVGFFFNQVVMPSPVLNFMLIGMAFSATFANMIPEARLEQLMSRFNPILGVAMIVVILNLGAPLDYHLILGAGLFTAIYILARAAGKYFGAYFGASITHAPQTVKKYLGLTLLPHSGVSLVFTGIAVSVLNGPDPESAKIIQGTIAAAAVINEIIAVVVAKKGFEWAGELQNSTPSPEDTPPSPSRKTVVTISRQHGSGGREVGRRLAEQLGIPFYDHQLIELAAKSSSLEQADFENTELSGVGSLLYDLAADVRQNLSVQDKIFLRQAEVIREVAEQGSCVIVGRCADYVLRNRPHVLRVFLYSDLESRKYRIEQIDRESEEIALEQIQKTDKLRSTYYQYYTGRRFGDAQNYDLCLNTSVLGVEECVRIIHSAFCRVDAGCRPSEEK